jgi:hypothetical protein
MPLAPLRCAVQPFESRDQQGTWAEHTTNGWYIGTSTEHYQCHKIYVKKTRSERISDTVFFKHKYITQPTLTTADTIVKAINNLTHALKGWRNQQEIAQIKALEKNDKILNNMPRTNTTKTTWVTFNESTAPPQATNSSA